MTLPAGWAWASLGEIAAEIKNGLPDKPADVPPGLPILRISAVRSGRVNLNDVRFHRGAPEQAEPYLLRHGDLLVVRYNGNADLTAACGMVRNIGGRTAYPDKLMRVRLHQRSALPDFVELAMRTPAARDQLASFIKTAAGQYGISGRDLRLIQLPLPPVAEQLRIVARIEALFARIRRARADLERVAPLAAHYQHRLLIAAMQGDLTRSWRDEFPACEPIDRTLRRIPPPPQPRGGREATDEVIPGIGALAVNHPGTEPPSRWSWVPLLRVARQESGHTPSRGHPEYWGGEIPWIGIRDAGAHHGGTICDTIQHATPLGIANSSARVLPAGTVCLSRTASVGYVTVMGRPMSTSQDFVTWTCSPALLPEFLKYALMAEGEDIRRFGKGSTHTTIYFPEIRALQICLPPLEEQREIVSRLDRALGAIQRVPSDTNRSLALLDHLEQSILTRAFRGELVPQDPNDEPASAAMAREAAIPTPPKSARGRPKKQAAIELFENSDYDGPHARSGVKV